MSEPVAYLATNPTHTSNADALVWEPKDWHITWEFKPLYLNPDPRVAELEAVLRECRVTLAFINRLDDDRDFLDQPEYEQIHKAIDKIDEILEK